MAGLDTILRLIGGTIALAFIAWVTAVGFMLVDPIYNNIIDQALFDSLGWGSPQNVVMLFMALSLVGLILVVIVWWIVGPIRRDVRQERSPGGPF